LKPRHHQRGVALMMAIIIVALATITATAIAYNSALAAKRGAGIYTLEQAERVAQGAEAMAAYALRQDAQTTGNRDDKSTDLWAAPYGPVEIEPGVTLEASVEDLQGRFNINNLVDGNGVADPVAREIFDRLLTLLGMETRWSGAITDWIDADSQPSIPDGAEDADYASQTPAYRTANMPITSVSELLALPGFGRKNYDKLRPYISALPPEQRINHCTASGLLLDALLGGKQEFSVNEELLVDKRKLGCFPLAPELQAAMTPQQWTRMARYITDASRFFRLRSIVSIGTTQFTLYSLINREQGQQGQIRTILRSSGTE
jgi:general secretion pathway protein K